MPPVVDRRLLEAHFAAVRQSGIVSLGTPLGQVSGRIVSVSRVNAQLVVEQDDGARVTVGLADIVSLEA